MGKHRMSDFELHGIRRLVEEQGIEDDLMTEIAEQLIREVDRLRELEAGSLSVVNTGLRPCSAGVEDVFTDIQPKNMDRHWSVGDGVWTVQRNTVE